MPDIEISVPHSLPQDEVKRRIEETFEKYKDQYSLTCSWQDAGCVEFVSSKGLKGILRFTSDAIALNVDISSFFVRPFSSLIRGRLVNEMEEILSKA